MHRPPATGLALRWFVRLGRVQVQRWQLFGRWWVINRWRLRRLVCRGRLRRFIRWWKRATNAGELVRPSALAVLRLITKSNYVGSSTGRSPGFSPFEYAGDIDAGTQGEMIV